MNDTSRRLVLRTRDSKRRKGKGEGGKEGQELTAGADGGWQQQQRQPPKKKKKKKKPQPPPPGQEYSGDAQGEWSSAGRLDGVLGSHGNRAAGKDAWREMEGESYVGTTTARGWEEREGEGGQWVEHSGVPGQREKRRKAREVVDVEDEEEEEEDEEEDEEEGWEEESEGGMGDTSDEDELPLSALLPSKRKEASQTSGKKVSTEHGEGSVRGHGED